MNALLKSTSTEAQRLLSSTARNWSLATNQLSKRLFVRSRSSQEWKMVLDSTSLVRATDLLINLEVTWKSCFHRHPTQSTDVRETTLSTSTIFLFWTLWPWRHLSSKRLTASFSKSLPMKLSHLIHAKYSKEKACLFWTTILFHLWLWTTLEVISYYSSISCSPNSSLRARRTNSVLF